MRGPEPDRERRRTAAGLLPLAFLLLAVLAPGAATGLPAQEPLPEEGGEARAVTLDEAVETASRRSPALRQAEASVMSARAQEQSFFGRYLPTLSLGYGFSEASTGRLDATGQAITNRSYTGQLRSSVTLFDGFQRRNDLRSARLEQSAAEATYEQRSFDAILAVKTAFYNAVAARRRVEVEGDRVERQEEQLRFVRERIRLGRATRSDTLRSRVDLNDARLALLTARDESRSAEFALAEAMGVEERVRPAEEASLEADSLPWDLEELIRMAVDRAPGVRSADLAASATEAGIGSARSSYWPSLQLSGGMDWRNDEFPPIDRSWSLSLSGSVPLFNGFQRESGIARAEAQATQARAQRRAAELAVRSDVQEAYGQIGTSLAALELAEESVEAAREDLRVTQQRYGVGVATILDLRSAQIGLQQSEVDRIRRRFDHQVGVARLESLLGARLADLAAEPGALDDDTNQDGRP